MADDNCFRSDRISDLLLCLDVGSDLVVEQSVALGGRAMKAVGARRDGRRVTPKGQRGAAANNARDDTRDMGTVMCGAEVDGPFYEGQNAFDRGEGRDACPSEAPDAIRRQWIDGWREAKRYADVRAIIEAARSASCLSATLLALVAGDEFRHGGAVGPARRRPRRRHSPPVLPRTAGRDAGGTLGR